jgi:predicted component of type VI protein secretion system
VFGLDRLVLGVSLSSVGLRDDLRDVVEEEFRRIISLFSGCRVVDNINIDWGVKIEGLDEIENELPLRFVKFIVRGSEVFSRIYSVVFVVPGRERIIASIGVYMIGSDCYVMRRVNESELEGAVSDIEAEGFEGG